MASRSEQIEEAAKALLAALPPGQPGGKRHALAEALARLDRLSKGGGKP